MTAIPPTFRAYVAERIDDPAGPRVDRGIRQFAESDLPDGEVEVRVEWSSVNYKDGLATKLDGKVARISPIIPGIDLAGTVVASADPSIAVGAAVVAHGYDLGVARHGGYAEYERVPANWVVPLGEGLSTREAMAIGTAGFTAGMSVIALEEHGLRPGDGPVLVTGASGGVGSVAVAILAERGHEVWAATGKADEADSTALARRGRDPGSRRGDGRGQATRVRAVGGCSRRGRCRDAAVCAADPAARRGGRVERQREWPEARDDRVPVHPARCRDARDGLGRRADRASSRHLGPPRRRTCDRAISEIGCAEVTLDTLDSALDAILAGEARGRWVVRVASG